MDPECGVEGGDESLGHQGQVQTLQTNIDSQKSSNIWGQFFLELYPVIISLLAFDTVFSLKLWIHITFGT